MGLDTSHKLPIGLARKYITQQQHGMDPDTSSLSYISSSNNKTLEQSFDASMDRSSSLDLDDPKASAGYYLLNMKRQKVSEPGSILIVSAPLLLLL